MFMVLRLVLIIYLLALSNLLSCKAISHNSVSPSTPANSFNCSEISMMPEDFNPPPPGYGPFRMLIKSYDLDWNEQKPLKVCIALINTGQESFYINFKSNFQFSGYLRNNHNEYIAIMWEPKGVKRVPEKSDYIEIKPKSYHIVQLASDQFLNEEDKKKFKTDKYYLSVTYSSGSKEYFFPGQWEGQNGTKEIEIRNQSNLNK